jgi:hypothetical protein
LLLIFLFVIFPPSSVTAGITPFETEEDTYSNAGQPTNIHGSNNYIRIRLGASNDKYGYFKFIVTGTGGDVGSAKFRLRTTGQDVPPDTGIYSVTGDWSEDTLTWDTDTLVWGALLDSANVNDANTWYEFDVTSAVTGDGTYTLGVKPITTGWVGRWSTKESGFIPELIITSSLPQATNPDPEDGTGNIPLDTILSFSPGDGATKHDIYLGLDSNDVNDSNTPLIRIDVNSFDPGGLMPQTTYYWRIDEVNDINDPELIWKGDVWSFTTRDILGASGPSPKDRAKNVPVDTLLSWTSGDYALLNDLYLGTDLGVVSDANVALARIDVNSFDPCGLLLDTTYYWRIDEVNDTPGAENIMKGQVWRFMTAEFLGIEGFDTYNDTNALQLSWDGADISIEDEYWGNSLKVIFDNNEAGVEFDPPLDLTAGGAKRIRLIFKGDPNNSATSMSLAIGDTLGGQVSVFYSDANDLAISKWQQWHIPISDFETAGLDVSGVNSLSLVLQGSGTSQFDSIRAYRESCFADFGPIADVTADCNVDAGDLRVLSRDWLLSDYNVSPVSPNDNELLVHYAFEETSGQAVGDSSGNGFDGTIIYAGDPNLAAPNSVWDANGYDGRSLAFDGNFGVLLAEDAFDGISDEMTLSVWLKGDALEEINFSAGPVKAEINDINVWTWDANDWDETGLVGSEGQLEPNSWHHLCFVKEAGSALNIYLNGLLVARDADAWLSLNGADANAVELGSGWKFGYFKGKMDEFRVYDYGLSHAEVLYLAEVGGSLYQPLEPVLSGADMFEDNKIDFRDFAILSEEWLGFP